VKVGVDSIVMPLELHGIDANECRRQRYARWSARRRAIRNWVKGRGREPNSTRRSTNSMTRKRKLCLRRSDICGHVCEKVRRNPLFRENPSIRLDVRGKPLRPPSSSSFASTAITAQQFGLTP